MNDTPTRNSPRPQQHIPPPGPAMREDQHETAHEPPRVRTRKRNASSNPTDEFYVNLAAVPPDVSVEWKLFTIVGEEKPFYLASMREQGWEPVDPIAHPDWVPVPPGYDKHTIIKSGLILMERPMALTREARLEAEAGARQQIVEAEQRLGMTSKGEADRVAPKVVKEMMRPIAIED